MLTIADLQLHLALLDLEKAFDKVQPSKLQEAMIRLGVSDTFVKVENAYSNRSNCCVMQYAYARERSHTFFGQ